MQWLYVALGGAIGASIRYGAGLYIGQSSIFPWATWWINIIGCLFAGLFFALSQKYSILQHEIRLFFMLGILGGFTTFSSFGLEVFQLLKQGFILTACMYSMSSVVVGVLSLAIGYGILNWWLNLS